MSFNLSNPATKKTTEDKVKWYEKIWSFLNLVALMLDGIVPKSTKDAIPLKVRNVIIISFIGILAYFLCTGVWYNSILLMEAVKGVHFSLGDKFYYYGIVAIISLAMGYFGMEDTMIKQKSAKKMVIQQITNINKGPRAAAAPSVNQTRFLARVISLLQLINGIWVIWGILFYDRWWFSTLLGLSLISSIASSSLKKVKYVRSVMILEIIISIIIVSLILNNHFLIFDL